MMGVKDIRLRALVLKFIGKLLLLSSPAYQSSLSLADKHEKTLLAVLEANKDLSHFSIYSEMEKADSFSFNDS